MRNVLWIFYEQQKKTIELSTVHIPWFFLYVHSLSVSLNVLGQNGQLFSVLFFAITWYKVRIPLQTIPLIFNHFCVTNIGFESGQMSIFRHLLASVYVSLKSMFFLT